MNKQVIDQLIEQKPALKQVRHKLEAMQPGTYCVHRAWGVGQIKSYDPVSRKLTIVFEKDAIERQMDPAFCAEKLDILHEHNFLSRQQKDPESIKKLALTQPVEMIVEFLKTCPDETCSTLELTRYFTLLLGEAAFKKHWNGIKKLLAKDPRISTPAKKNGVFAIREIPMSAEQEIIDIFFTNKNLKNRLAIAERLVASLHDAEGVRDSLLQVSAALSECINSPETLTHAERLQAYWLQNSLHSFLKLPPSEHYSSEFNQLFTDTPKLEALVEALPYTYYKRFLKALQELHPETYPQLCLELIKGSNGRFINEAVGFLIELKYQDLLTQALQKWLSEQMLKGPILNWIVKNRNVRKFTDLIKDLQGPKLLTAIFYSIDLEALQSNSTRSIPLADLVNEDKTLIADLLEGASDETGKDLAQMLQLNQGFEALTKRSLLARFIKLFPVIQQMISGEAHQNKQAEQLIVSEASLTSAKKEYDHLVMVKLPEIKKAIASARDLGDLSENSEYKMARQDQEVLMARKTNFEKDFMRAQITDFSDASTEQVDIGSQVTLIQETTKKKQVFSILGAWDSDPEKNIVSYMTPLAQSLMRKKVGDSVTLEIGNKKENWSIQSITRWVDSKEAKAKL